MYEMYHEKRKLLTDAECTELRERISDTSKFSKAYYTSVREVHMNIPDSDENEYIIRTSSEEKNYIYLIKRTLWNGIVNEYRTIISKDDCMHLLSMDTKWMENNPHPIISEIFLQIEYNECEWSQIKERLLEVYVNPLVGERITINVLTKISTNTITEMLKPVLTYYPYSHKKAYMVSSQQALVAPRIVINQRSNRM